MGEEPDATSEFNQHSPSTQDRPHTHTHMLCVHELMMMLTPPMPVSMESGHPSENRWMKRMKPSFPPASLGKREGEPPSGKHQAKKWRPSAGTRPRTGHTGTQGFRLRREAGTEKPLCENPNQLPTQAESQQPDSEAQNRKGEGAGGRSPGSQLLGLMGSRVTSPHSAVIPSPGQGRPKAAVDGRRRLAGGSTGQLQGSRRPASAEQGRGEGGRAAAGM